MYNPFTFCFRPADGSSASSSSMSKRKRTSQLKLNVGSIRMIGLPDKKHSTRFFVENGARLFEALITACQGKINPIRMFTAQELATATDNYDESNFLGSGISMAYRGIHDGRSIAVKKFMDVSFDMFINEAVSLAQISHKNVVRLLGCCIETQFPILVFEFISNGRLSDHIHTFDPACRIPWDHRLRIANEVADALAYVHIARHRPIIHRNIRVSSILLDEHYCAKVATFGFSALIPDGHAKEQSVYAISTRSLSQEHLHPLADREDVYDFGVVMIELLTGKSPFRPVGWGFDTSFLDLFRSSFKVDLQSVLETGVLREGKTEQLMACAELAAKCIGEIKEERPTIKEVAQELRCIRRCQ